MSERREEPAGLGAGSGTEETDPERPSARPGATSASETAVPAAPSGSLAHAPTASHTIVTGHRPSPFEDRLTRQSYRDAHEMVDDYLRRFADAVNIEPVRLDPEGYAELIYGSISVGVNVLAEHGVLLLLSRMRSIPGDEREAFYRRLLELNFLLTSDAAFAIDAESSAVYLRVHRRLGGLDFEELADALVSIGRVADEWDARLAALYPEPS